MRIAFRYNHLLAEEYLFYRKKELIEELEQCIENIDANQYLKMSCDKKHFGEIYYDQKALNKEIKRRLNANGWQELKIAYYVTEDETVSKEIVKLADKEEQKRIIESKGLVPLGSNNQVDFLKERIAVEVQFGKYFSVAYDLHVKHTFFFIRDDIDVGIEIIPTHRMMKCMDTGVAWYENEVTNVIREGRNNPSVPVYILGIEATDHIDTEPSSFLKDELIRILNNSDKDKLVKHISEIKEQDQKAWDAKIQKAKDIVDELQLLLDELNKEYLSLKEAGANDDSREIRNLMKKCKALLTKRNKAYEKYEEVKGSIPNRLARISLIEELL